MSYFGKFWGHDKGVAPGNHLPALALVVERALVGLSIAMKGAEHTSTPERKGQRSHCMSPTLTQQTHTLTCRCMWKPAQSSSHTSGSDSSPFSAPCPTHHLLCCGCDQPIWEGGGESWNLEKDEHTQHSQIWPRNRAKVTSGSHKCMTTQQRTVHEALTVSGCRLGSTGLSEGGGDVR